MKQVIFDLTEKVEFEHFLREHNLHVELTNHGQYICARLMGTHRQLSCAGFYTMGKFEAVGVTKELAIENLKRECSLDIHYPNYKTIFGIPFYGKSKQFPSFK